MNESKKIKKVMEDTGLLKKTVNEDISKDAVNSLLTQLKQKIDEYSKTFNAKGFDKSDILLFSGTLEDFSFSFKKFANR